MAVEGPYRRRFALIHRNELDYSLVNSKHSSSTDDGTESIASISSLISGAHCAVPKDASEASTSGNTLLLVCLKYNDEDTVGSVFFDTLHHQSLVIGLEMAYRTIFCGLSLSIWNSITSF